MSALWKAKQASCMTVKRDSLPIPRTKKGYAQNIIILSSYSKTICVHSVDLSFNILCMLSCQTDLYELNQTYPLNIKQFINQNSFISNHIICSRFSSLFFLPLFLKSYHYEYCTIFLNSKIHYFRSQCYFFPAYFLA